MPKPITSVELRFEPVNITGSDIGHSACEVHVFGPDDTELDGGPLLSTLTNLAEGFYYPPGAYLRPVTRR